MGIARGAIKSLMQEGIRQPFAGTLLTLGRQDIYPRVHRLLYSLYLRTRRRGLGLQVDAKY